MIISFLSHNLNAWFNDHISRMSKRVQETLEINVQHFFRYWRRRWRFEALPCLIKAPMSYLIISGVHRSRISVWRPCTPGSNSTRMYFSKCQGNHWCNRKEKGYLKSAVIWGLRIFTLIISMVTIIVIIVTIIVIIVIIIVIIIVVK